MKDLIETFVRAGRTVSIFYDVDPPNPRKDYDHLVTLACWHRRQNLGDKQIPGGMTEEELRERLQGEGEEILALLPISLHDHGSQSMTTGISRGWDSGQVGWAYVTKTSAERMGCTGDRWKEAIEAEVTEYSAYLEGECYGYEITGLDGDELDSCWGFIGELEYVLGVARDAADHADDPAVQRRADELQGRATYAAGGAP